MTRLGTFKDPHVAVAQKTGTKWLALGSGNMDQNLCSPSCLILSHTHVPFSGFHFLVVFKENPGKLVGRVANCENGNLLEAR